MRRLAIDPGTKRVGVALAEDDEPRARALATLDRSSDAQCAGAIAELVGREEVGEIVVGLPLSMDGTEGPSALRARALGSAIATASARKVILWDERLSSAAAHRAMRASEVGGRAQRARVDGVAAVWLLESYLEALRARRARRARAKDAG